MQFADKVKAQKQGAQELMEKLFPPQFPPTEQLPTEPKDRQRKIDAYQAARNGLTGLGAFQVLRQLLETMQEGGRGQIDIAVPLALFNAMEQKEGMLLLSAEGSGRPLSMQIHDEFGDMRRVLKHELLAAIKKGTIFKSGTSASHGPSASA